MDLWEIVLIGVALSMDAFAVGMTDGMTEPGMRPFKHAAIALTFGGMQFLMPVLGYFGGGIFADLLGKIAPYLSFFLLALIGGKSVAGYFIGRKNKEPSLPRPAGAGAVLLQGVATSLDALAVGVTFVAAEATKGLPMSAIGCAGIIGVITFCLSLLAIFLGRKAGDRFADKAELLGGIVLILIGVKILVEGLV